MNRFAKTLVATSLVIAAAASAARADILAYGSHKTLIGLTTSQRELPLRPNGDTKITFRTTKVNELVVITYNAVCYVQSYSIYGGRGSVRIRITIDGTEPHPQTGGSDTAFCSAWSPGTDMDSVSRQAALVVRQPGVHTAKVYGILDYAAYNGGFYGSSTLVQN